MSWHLIASPEYLLKTGVPQSPYDLFKRKRLKVGWQPATGHWTLDKMEGVKTTVPFSPQYFSDDMDTLKQASVGRLGLVSLPAYVCHQKINEGRLVRVLPDRIADKAQLSLMMPSRKG